jgi:hypothetical protein
MKLRFTAVLLGVLLVLPLALQAQVEEWVTHKPMGENDPGFSVQIAGGDKVGAQLQAAWAIPDFDEEMEVDDLDVNWINWAKTDYVNFIVNYTAQFSTKVRFRLIITGPDFYMRTSDHWYPAKYKTSSSYGVSGPKENFFQTKGVYTVIFIAEQQKAFGGTECVATCKVRVF